MRIRFLKLNSMHFWQLSMTTWEYLRFVNTWRPFAWHIVIRPGYISSCHFFRTTLSVDVYSSPRAPLMAEVDIFGGYIAVSIKNESQKKPKYRPALHDLPARQVMLSNMTVLRKNWVPDCKVNAYIELRFLSEAHEVRLWALVTASCGTFFGISARNNNATSFATSSITRSPK